jgi:hypothetical protein
MLWHYLTEYPRWMIDLHGPFGWWGPAYLVAGAAALWRSPDVVRLVLCVIVVTLGYLTVGTADLTSYFPVYHQPRYLLALMPLATILLVYAFGRLRAAGPAGHWVAAAVAVALIGNSIHYASLNAGKPYEAGTFAAGRKLFNAENRPWPADARLCASGETLVRLWPLAESSGHRPIEYISEPPTTPADWMRRYAGTYVLVSRRDRSPHRDALGVLTPESRAALSAFPKAATAAPGATRLGEIAAWLGLCGPRSDQERRLEVYHVAAVDPPALRP